MSDQPEALRLADYMDAPLNNPADVADAAASELRRLHAELAAMTARTEAAEVVVENSYIEIKRLRDEVIKVEDARDEARAELARLTTLRPYETWVSGQFVPALLWAKYDGEWVCDPLFEEATHWTPLPDVKEANK